MPQNTLTNKFSSIIGFLLLAGIVGFTVVTNIFVQKTEAEARKEHAWEVKLANSKLEAFQSNDLAKLWKLENLQTDSIKIDYDKKRTLITIINYGKIDFRHSYNGKHIMTFEDFLLKGSVNHKKLTDIGSLFVKYQIQSIHTTTELGDFTHINFKDGRSIFLVKKNAKLEEEYKRILGNAQSLNDSTKLLYSN
ncbi:hypothetical protein ACE193_20860 [Bernardetia sp. OM2101]|uniref:hypothetical protein n=1 Tax=Bernardetia sp. OM2101 TaxID=3344876 RepID=UPI0035CEB5A6